MTLGLFYACLKNDTELEAAMKLTHIEFLDLIKSNLNIVKRISVDHHTYSTIEFVRGNVSNYMEEMIEEYGTEMSVKDSLLYLYDCEDSFVEHFLNYQDIDLKDGFEVNPGKN